MAITWQNSQRYIPEFGENKKSESPVSCRAKRMTVGDMLKMQGKIREKQEQLGDEIDFSQLDQVEAYWDVISFCVTNYTSEWENVNLGEKPLTAGEEIIENCDAPSMPLLAEVFSHIMGISTVDEEEAKKSEVESGQENSDSTSTVETA